MTTATNIKTISELWDEGKTVLAIENSDKVIDNAPGAKAGWGGYEKIDLSYPVGTARTGETMYVAWDSTSFRRRCVIRENKDAARWPAAEPWSSAI